MAAVGAPLRVRFRSGVAMRYRVHESSLSHALTDAKWWETEMKIRLKHLGYTPVWDSVLWDWIVTAAYRLDRPERLEYARANCAEAGPAGVGGLRSLSPRHPVQARQTPQSRHGSRCSGIETALEPA